MSTESNKSEIFNKIKLYASIAYSDLQNKSFESLVFEYSNPNNFLFDLLKVTIGENGIEQLAQLVLSNVITQKALDTLSDKIYDTIGENISENLSSATQTINIDVKSIDPSNALRKTNLPSGATNSQNAFFNNLKEKVLNFPSVDVNFNLVGINDPIKMKYDEVLNNIAVTLPEVNARDLFNGLRGTIGPMFSSAIIINEIINILFHTDFKKEDAQILALVRSYVNYETKDVFKLDLKKLLDLENDTSVEGYNVDVSCYRENITVTKEQINDIITNPTVENFKTLVPNFSTESNGSSNGSNDFLKKLIQAIIEAILSMIIKQPVILFLMSIVQKLLDVTFDIKNIDIAGLFDKFKALIEKIFDNLYEIIFCIMFNWIKKYLLKLVVLVTIKLLREQIDKRKNILLSLTGNQYLQAVIKTI